MAIGQCHFPLPSLSTEQNDHCHICSTLCKSVTNACIIFCVFPCLFFLSVNQEDNVRVFSWPRVSMRLSVSVCVCFKLTMRVTCLCVFSVDQEGNVCISILHEPGDDKYGYEKASERWLPIHTVETILVSVISMLADPNDESPANVDAAVSLTIPSFLPSSFLPFFLFLP